MDPSVRILATHGLLVASSLLFPATATAHQEPATTGHPTPEGAHTLAADRHSRLYFTEHADGTWVRGRTYKARVSSDGFSYVPFLGSDAPRNFPVDFRLVSATLAGEPLGLSSQALVERNGDRFVLDRGAVDVIYDVALESVEQSFAVDAAGATGDLVLRMRIDTELGALPDSGGLAFRGDYGGVDYSAAFVFDGAGRRADVPMRLDGDQLELTVPASFLADATGPILVDPLVATYAIDDISLDLDHVDIAFDASHIQNTYVYEEHFSVADSDVYCRTYDSLNNTLVGGSYIDSSADSWSGPKIANADAANQDLIVARKVSATTGRDSIVGRFFDEASLLAGPEFTIAAAAQGQLFLHTDVGGHNDLASLDPKYLVAWDESDSLGSPTGVSLRTVSAIGALGPIRSITGAGVGWHVAVSKANSTKFGFEFWNVVCGWNNGNGGSEHVLRAEVDAAGMVPVSSIVHTSPAGSFAYDFDVSESIVAGGSLPKFVLSFVETSPQSVGSKRVLLCNSVSVLRDIDLNVMEHESSTLPAHGIRVGTTWHPPSPPEFLIAYHQALPTGGTGVFMTTLDAYSNRAIAISERKTFLGVSTPNSPGGGSLALTSRSSGGFHSQFSLLAWTQYSSATSSTDIVGATHVANFPTAVGEQFCQGTPNSTGRRGFLAAYGDNSVSGDKELFATSLPQHSVGYFLCGQGSTPVHFPGTSQGVLCLGGGAIGRYSNFATSTGTQAAISLLFSPTALSTPTGPVAATVGERWNFQLWHRDSAGGGAATSNFTNAVQIQF